MSRLQKLRSDRSAMRHARNPKPDPAAWRAGRYPQLEKAVEVVMEELKKNPRPQPKRPAYPNYHTGSVANK